MCVCVRARACEMRIHLISLKCLDFKSINFMCYFKSKEFKGLFGRPFQVTFRAF